MFKKIILFQIKTKYNKLQAVCLQKYFYDFIERNVVNLEIRHNFSEIYEKIIIFYC